VKRPPDIPEADANGRTSLAHWGWAPGEIERLLSTGAAR
jgi:hypothetical protein